MGRRKGRIAHRRPQKARRTPQVSVPPPRYVDRIVLGPKHADLPARAPEPRWSGLWQDDAEVVNRHLRELHEWMWRNLPAKGNGKAM